MMVKENLLIVLCILISSSFAFADTVYLKNGNELEGIIIIETEETVELEVDIGARITLTYQDIKSVTRSSLEENKRLEEIWVMKREKREEQEEERRRYEAQQKAKGLVQYRGKWIKEEEKEKLVTKRLIDEIFDEKNWREKIPKIDTKEISYAAKILLVEENWRYRETEHFIVYYKDLNQGKVVADRAEYMYEKISYDLGYEKEILWYSKCKVFIIPEQYKWNEFLNKINVDIDIVGGFVSHGQREIFLCALSLPYLSVAFPHELSHVIFREFANGKYIPLWLNEGLAVYESGLTSYANQLLEEKLKTGEYILLGELLQLRNYPRDKKDIELFYAESEKIVEFLITQHGRSSFSNFCKLTLNGEPFEYALKNSCRGEYRDIEAFSKAWIRYIIK